MCEKGLTQFSSVVLNVFEVITLVRTSFCWSKLVFPGSGNQCKLSENDTLNGKRVGIQVVATQLYFFDK